MIACLDRIDAENRTTLCEMIVCDPYAGRLAREYLDALLGVRLIHARESTEPARNLTIEEVRAVGDALRNEHPAIESLAAFLNCSPAQCRAMLDIAQGSRALDSVLTTCLLVRLHAVRVSMSALYESTLVVVEHRRRKLRRAAAH